MGSQPVSSKQPNQPERLKFVSPQVLIERGEEIHRLIEHRAYEILERRGRAHGSDVSDWLWAESGGFTGGARPPSCGGTGKALLKAEMPGNFTASELELSIEPRRLMVSGERKVDAIYGAPEGSHIQKMPERIFRVHELPVEIDPSRTTATLQDDTLEVVMPKAMAVTGSIRHEQIL